MYTQTVRVFDPMGYLVPAGVKITYEEWTVVENELDELVRRDIKPTDAYGEAIFLNANETYYRRIYGEGCRTYHGLGQNYIPDGGLTALALDIVSCSEQTEHFATAKELLANYDTNADGYYDRIEAIMFLSDWLGGTINESEGSFCMEFMEANFDPDTEEFVQNINIDDWCASLPVPNGTNLTMLLLLGGIGVLGAFVAASGNDKNRTRY